MFGFSSTCPLKHGFHKCMDGQVEHYQHAGPLPGLALLAAQPLSPVCVQELRAQGIVPGPPGGPSGYEPPGAGQRGLGPHPPARPGGPYDDTPTRSTVLSASNMTPGDSSTTASDSPAGSSLGPLPGRSGVRLGAVGMSNVAAAGAPRMAGFRAAAVSDTGGWQRPAAPGLDQSVGEADDWDALSASRCCGGEPGWRMVLHWHGSLGGWARTAMQPCTRMHANMHIGMQTARCSRMCTEYACTYVCRCA
jgi:hypothetical protein